MLVSIFHIKSVFVIHVVPTLSPRKKISFFLLSIPSIYFRTLISKCNLILVFHLHIESVSVLFFVYKLDREQKFKQEKRCQEKIKRLFFHNIQMTQSRGCLILNDNLPYGEIHHGTWEAQKRDITFIYRVPINFKYKYRPIHYKAKENSTKLRNSPVQIIDQSINVQFITKKIQVSGSYLAQKKKMLSNVEKGRSNVKILSS